MSAAAAPQPGLPEGWRWESYLNAELAVPGSWGHYNNSTCEVPRTGPGVGRPGLMQPYACRRTASAADVQFVSLHTWFDGQRAAGTVGDRTTLHVGSARVDVQAEKKLRERILATVRVTETDTRGCAASDPIARRPWLRPDPAVALARLQRRTGRGEVGVAALHLLARPLEHRTG